MLRIAPGRARQTTANEDDNFSSFLGSHERGERLCPEREHNKNEASKFARIRTKTVPNCSSPEPSARPKGLADVHSSPSLFVLSHQVVLAQQPTPILPDPKLTPGDTFDVTAQDVCVPGYAKKVRAVPAWLKSLMAASPSISLSVQEM